MINIKILLSNLLKILTPRSGAHIRGELKTPACGVVISANDSTMASSIAALKDKVRYSSGLVGCCELSSAYTQSSTTIPVGSYNYIYIPHRSGGYNQRANGDNHNYGNILLFTMNGGGASFDLRISGGNVAEVNKISTVCSDETIATSHDTTNYKVYNTSSNYVKRFGRLVIVSFYIQCVSPVQWASNYTITGLPPTYENKEVYGALCEMSNSSYTSVSVAIQGDGSVKFGGGKANARYTGLVYYIAA